MSQLRSLLALTISIGVLCAAGAAPTPDQQAFRAIYQELIETNTTLSAGNCTTAAQSIAARLHKAGFPEGDVKVIVPPDFPKQGNIVAVLPGTDQKLDAVLLLAHLDVVEAKREDWERDPFKLVEEDGYFYARGATDDKAMAAIFIDAMIRFKRDGYSAPRTIKLMLTCGEETPNTFDGARYLVENYRDLIDAALAINEGGGGRLDAAEKRIFNGVQAGEKVYQDFRIEITNPGGHSSRPVKDNAIYRLAAALTRIGQYEFPIELNETTRTFFERMADIEGGSKGADFRAIAKQPPDAQALARVTEDPSYNSIMRTTCVATMLDGGHAPNGLPQRAGANVNCRILPSHPQEEVRGVLEKVVADPGVHVTFASPPEKVSPPPQLTPNVMRPILEITQEMWPGMPVVPSMAAGATDGRFLTPAGIPTYGVSGLFMDPETTKAHGLNERMRVQSLYEGREFLVKLIKRYANSESVP
jgi:acetylornithine deacetylase/succinyl-diaminopimelate desuccinylase-like protein